MTHPLLFPCSQSLYLQKVFRPSQFLPWVQESVPESKQARRDLGQQQHTDCETSARPPFPSLRFGFLQRGRGRVLRASWEHDEKELMSTSFMSGSDPGGRWHRPGFTDERSEAQRGHVACPRPHPRNGPGRESHTDPWTPELCS